MYNYNVILELYIFYSTQDLSASFSFNISKHVELPHLADHNINKYRRVQVHCAKTYV